MNWAHLGIESAVAVAAIASTYVSLRLAATVADLRREMAERHLQIINEVRAHIKEATGGLMTEKLCEERHRHLE